MTAREQYTYEDQDYIEFEDTEEFVIEDLEYFEALRLAHEVAERFYREALYQDREQGTARIFYGRFLTSHKLPSRPISNDRLYHMVAAQCERKATRNDR